MVNLIEVSDIKRDLEILLIEQEKESDIIQSIMQKAEMAGAYRTAGMMRALLDHEAREKEAIKKLIDLYASTELQLSSAGCPVVGDMAGINAMVQDFSMVNTVYDKSRGYSGYGTRGRY